jgi:3D (Asp-Asp-Asp) domain-containing protein
MRIKLKHAGILAFSLASLLMKSDSNAGGCETYTITAYSIEQFPGTTADGTSTQGQAGVIAAVDARAPVVRMGTYVWIEDMGTYRIADTGNLARRGVHFDVLMSTTREAREFGRQQRQVCW